MAEEKKKQPTDTPPKAGSVFAPITHPLINIIPEKQEDSDALHPADLADHLEHLSPEKRMDALRQMAAEDAADALAELEGNLAADLLENMDSAEAAQIPLKSFFFKIIT